MFFNGGLEHYQVFLLIKCWQQIWLMESNDEMRDAAVFIQALGFPALLIRCTISGSNATMEAPALAFDPEACGTAADWNAHAAYLTWNKRSAARFNPGEVPLTVKERL